MKSSSIKTLHGTTIKTEKYSQERIELIKRNLQQFKSMGQTQFYEIQVDGLKVVPKTDDIQHFDSHEMYLGEDVMEIKILLFFGTSQKYNAFIFYFNDNEEDSKPNTLHGIMDSVDERVKQALLERDLADLKKQNEILQEDLDTANELSERLEEAVEQMKQKLTELSTNENNQQQRADLITNFLRYINDFLKRQPNVLEGLPLVGKALANDFRQKYHEDQIMLQHQIQMELNNANQNPPPEAHFKEKT